MNDKILELKNLRVSYGAIEAVKGINLTVEKGTIVAILGSNGAGKTSTLKAIDGIIKCKGEVVFDGENIANKESYKIASLGLNHSLEGRLILAGLTVEENLRVGAYSIKPKVVDGKKLSVSSQVKANLETVFGYFPVLKERRKQQAHTLSGGEQQMLAIGRALMSNPKLLLLDEPSLGLAPMIVKDIFEIIVKIRNEGGTILIVEQNAFQTLKIADYAYVLELGKISMQGKCEDLLKDERLVEAYLGGKEE